MLRIGLWTTALLLTVGWAVWRGGRDERVTALVLAVADLGARLHRPTAGWLNLDPVSVALDLALLAFLLHRAFITTRWWPMYACAAQVCATSGLAGYLLSALRLPDTYNVNSVVWSYAILASLAVGLTFERARVLEERSDRLYRTSAAAA